MGVRQITTTIHVCDRCGDDGEVGVAGSFKDGHAEIRYVDKRKTASTTCNLYFCQDCRNDFEKFLHEKGAAANPKEGREDCG